MDAPKKWGYGLSEQAVSYKCKCKDQEFSRMEFKPEVAIKVQKKPIEIKQVDVIENAFSCKASKPLPWGTGTQEDSRRVAPRKEKKIKRTFIEPV